MVGRPIPHVVILTDVNISSRQRISESPTSEQTGQAVPIRDVHLEEAVADVPKYFADGDIVLSHVFAVLSATFPPGEDYFVRSVAAAQDRITDVALAENIEGFIGQESMHGREHRAFNARLADLGYPTRAIERYTERTPRQSRSTPTATSGAASGCVGSPWLPSTSTSSSSWSC